MSKLMVPLHDGSGFAEIGSLVKWTTKPLLNDQKKRIIKHGRGPFTVLECIPSCLLFVDRHGNRVAAKPEWLVPAKSLLAGILGAMAQMVPKVFVSDLLAEMDIKRFGDIILSTDLTNAEKKQAVARLEEMTKSLFPSGDESNTRRYLKGLIAALQKK